MVSETKIKSVSKMGIKMVSKTGIRRVFEIGIKRIWATSQCPAQQSELEPEANRTCHDHYDLGIFEYVVRNVLMPALLQP